MTAATGRAIRRSALGRDPRATRSPERFERHAEIGRMSRAWMALVKAARPTTPRVAGLFSPGGGLIAFAARSAEVARRATVAGPLR